MVSGLIGWMISVIRPGDRVERVWRSFARIHQEVWIVAPVGLLSMAVTDWRERDYFSLFFDAVNLWNWWNLRNWPEDNHWKRRAKKAKEAVAVRAGRLVVVPAGAS